MATGNLEETIRKIINEKKRIAVVGLSDNPERTSYGVTEAMQNAGYEIIPVNPMIKEWKGIPAVSSLKDIDGHVDVVNVFRQSKFLPEIAKETVEIGADVLWGQLGVENEEAREYAEKNGVTVVMNRCIKVEHAKYRNR
ncbi:CoA-binding protein [Pueribacillus theae]|uniref:CoA-binding protein n=1 Tax=Pueribacillus theae TaxID=2171751 RepID=A0A2U1JVP1_9BACI|nr:CoA-binding protein [Pueribacillus theae]PWA08893.1 CoA-binding protein [Pueribacillus theae]